MSVINSMLNALDARRAPPLPGTTAVAVEHGPTKSRRWQVMAVIGAAAVTATALADWPVLLSTEARQPLPVTLADPAPQVATPESTTTPATVQLAIAAPTAPRMRAPRVSARQSPSNPTPAPRDAELPLATATLVRSVQSAAAPNPAAAPTAPKGTAEKSPIPLSAAQRATVAYRHALELGQSGHSHAAIERALEALRADPDHAGARQLAAVLMFEAQRLDEAGALLRAGLDRTPQQPRLAYLLARLKAETGDADGALALLPAGTALAGEAHGLRAAILARQGRYVEALPAYEAALRLDPSNAAWWLGLGLALEANEQTDLARQALRRARALGTLRPDVQTYVEQKLASLG